MCIAVIVAAHNERLCYWRFVVDPRYLLDEPGRRREIAKRTAGLLSLLLLISIQAASRHARADCAGHDCGCCSQPGGGLGHVCCTACYHPDGPQPDGCACRPDGCGEERQVPAPQQLVPGRGAPKPCVEAAEPPRPWAPYALGYRPPRSTSVGSTCLARAPPRTVPRATERSVLHGGTTPDPAQDHGPGRT